MPAIRTGPILFSRFYRGGIASPHYNTTLYSKGKLSPKRRNTAVQTGKIAVHYTPVTQKEGRPSERRAAFFYTYYILSLAALHFGFVLVRTEILNQVSRLAIHDLAQLPQRFRCYRLIMPNTL